MSMTERHTVWTHAEESLLVTGFRAGLGPEHMAEALHKTPGSIRWKLNALGLLKGNPDATGPTSETVTLEDYEVRKSDLAFKRAVLKAIASGAEKVVPRVVRAKPTARYIPCVRPASDSGYRSSAALAAELGSHEPPLESTPRATAPRPPGTGGAQRAPSVAPRRTSTRARRSAPASTAER